MRLGVSQQTLAELADVDRTTISNIERGRGAPQEDVLRRILSALGVATDASSLDPEIELWLAMMGELLASTPHARRDLAADAAIATLAAHVRAADEPPRAAGQTGVRSEVLASEQRLAALRGVARKDTPHAE